MDPLQYFSVHRIKNIFLKGLSEIISSIVSRHGRDTGMLV
jgi:hypothetical protein